MKYIYRVYEWLFAIPTMIVITIITAIITLVGSLLGGQRTFGYYPPKIWSRCVCWLFLVRVKVVGRENISKKQSYVFVANHQSAFDIWAIYGYLNHNFKWMMRIGLKKIPLVGYACYKAGQIYVDDSSIAGIKDTISQAQKHLKNGMSVVIFPEGTRSWDGKMASFRRGAFMLAGEFRLPVVPITIDGAFDRFPRYAKNITPGKITVTIHKPIEPGPSGFNTKKLMSECYETIESALPERHKNNA